MRQPVGKSNTKVLIGIFVISLIAAITSILFGQSDIGQIDVSAAIANSNVAARQSGGQTTPIPTSNANAALPNGGLVGRGKSKPVLPPAKESASTTDATTTETTGQ